MFMCKVHWRMVPRALRDAIWATYRPGQERDKTPSDAYLDTARAAQVAVADAEGVPVPPGIRRRVENPSN